VKAEPDRLAQVFINLVSNALKYNDKDQPIVQVSGRIDGDMVRYEVRDNGPGVAAQDRDRIFLKFSRGWDRTDTGGAGLGLAISRQITRRFGGDLTLKCAGGGGEGTCFEVTIPLLATRP
jgi:signal transduction histidine kinase